MNRSLRTAFGQPVVVFPDPCRKPSEKGRAVKGLIFRWISVRVYVVYVYVGESGFSVNWRVSWDHSLGWNWPISAGGLDVACPLSFYLGEGKRIGKSLRVFRIIVAKILFMCFCRFVLLSSSSINRVVCWFLCSLVVWLF